MSSNQPGLGDSVLVRLCLKKKMKQMEPVVVYLWVCELVLCECWGSSSSTPIPALGISQTTWAVIAA